jgi:alpha-beta hydrolase superfamily lysophospholipase
MRLFAVFAFLAGLAACAPTIRPAGPPIAQTSLETDMFRAADGTELPLQHWGDVENPDAVILALHGMGDYANAFMELGDGLGQNHRIAVYAFDQRGFGRSPSRPFWAGISTMVNDASDVLTLLRARYPGKPVYLLGNSMGGAVAIVTAASRGHLMDGLILVAPAVWNRDMMPWYQTAPLAVMSHSFPWLPLTGKGLDIWPSDNIEMLRRLSRDPNMMSSVRVDLIAGVADIMDLARKRAVDISVPTLLLSGAQDQVIPPDAVTALDRDLAGAGIVSYHRCLYDAGYHMLLRDLNGPVVIADIGRWIAGGGVAENYSCTQS